MKMNKLLFACLFLQLWAFGQVGINIANPNSKAALEVVSPSTSDNRGVLLPRMSTAQMNTIATDATTVGLMVFNTDEKSFYYHDGSNWIALVPKQTLSTVANIQPKIGNIVIDSGSVITQNAEVKSTLTINGNLNVNGFAQNALVPTGSIMMWSGDPNALPAGWGLCNGNYYWSSGPVLGGITPPLPPYFVGFQLIQSPDLRGRFIVGFDSGAPTSPYIATNNGTDINYGSVGNMGGENGHLLTNDESGLPIHSHLITDPGHTHSLNSYIGSGDGFVNGDDNGDGALQGNSAYSWVDPHSTGITINDCVAQNATVPHENRPPYYVLAYIIKLP